MDVGANGRFRVAIDIGGTFTDFVVQDAASGLTGTGKLLNTPGDLANGVVEGLARFVPPAGEVDFLVHGTTAGLNALIERRGAKVLLVTTEGFRDVYTIAGNDRTEIFNIRYHKPSPLVLPQLVVEARERLAADGSVVVPLDLGSLEPALEVAEAEGAEAVAICLLFSYLNPAHELAVERFFQERLPGVPVTCSHRISREWREYARTSTAVMNAYVAPIVTRYLTSLMDRLAAGVTSRTSTLLVMQSNGGVMTAGVARQLPLQTLLSGPVGGAIGAQQLARDLARDNLICVDMGGTSFDASLVLGNAAPVSNEAEVEGLPVQMPIVDIHGVGAGGGSIGWTEAGALRVGPKSAGAGPGPACYGRGGTEPTVTDANLILGRLDQERFAGGGMVLDADAARKAVTRLGEQIGLGLLETAQGIIDVVNAKMADAISTVTVRRGIDPREFALLAFGGAGPMHAADIAARLDISEVVVPVFPGAFSAWGMLQTDFRRDVRSTHYEDLGRASPRELEARYGALEAEAAGLLGEEGISKEAMSFERTADLRYTGQEYAVATSLGPSRAVDIGSLRRDFDALYLERYGHSNPAAPAEIVKLGVVATGRVARPGCVTPPVEERTSWRRRQVFFGGRPYDCTIVPREQLGTGERLAGPLIMEEATATTVVPPGWSARALEGGHILVRREEP